MQLFTGVSLWIVAAAALSAQPGSGALTVQRMPEWEAKLAANPADRSARTELLSLYFTQKGSPELPPDAIKAARRKHILWMVENDPGSPVFQASLGWIDVATTVLADPDGHQLVIDAWRRTARRSDLTAEALTNAAHELQADDPELAIACAEKAVAKGSLPEGSAESLGSTAAAILLGSTRMLMGASIQAADPGRASAEPAQRARKLLQTSRDPKLLEAAILLLPLGAGSLRERKELEFDPAVYAETVLAAWVKRRPRDPLPYWLWLGLLNSRAASESDPAKRGEWWRLGFEKGEVARALMPGEPDPYRALDHTHAAFESGNDEKTVLYGKALLATLPAAHVWYRGNVLHDVNCWLGFIALKRGDQAAAVKFLGEAAKSPGSPQLNSFGPDFGLAKELAELGERGPVIAYLERIGAFWKMDNGNLAEWIGVLREGGVPGFNKEQTRGQARFRLAGKPAPPIPEVTTLTGQKWNLAKLRGKIVLVQFWATWCVPCRAEMPALSAFYQAHHQEGLEMIGLSASEDPELVRSFLEKNPVSYPAAVASATVLSAYSASVLPSAFWIHRDGTIAVVDGASGPGIEEKLERRWRQMLNGKVQLTVPLVPLVPLAQGQGTVHRVGNGVSAAITVPCGTAILRGSTASGAQRARQASLAVGEDGLPRDLKVQRGASFGLDEQAIAAVWQWRFQPAMKDGAARPVLDRGKVSAPREASSGTWAAGFDVDDQEE